MVISIIFITIFTLPPVIAANVPNTDLTYGSFEIEGYTVSYDFQGTVHEMIIDKETKSLIIKLTRYGALGILYIDLPRGLIDAKSGSIDTDFILLQNGQPWAKRCYDKTRECLSASGNDWREMDPSSDDIRTLVIYPNTNVNEIVISGTHLLGSTAQPRCPPHYDLVDITRSTKGGNYLIDLKYGPPYPATGCNIEWFIEFKNKFHETEFLNEVQYDIFVVDEKLTLPPLRSLAKEEGHDFLFSESGQVHKSTIVKENPGIAHYVIWVYGLAPENVVPDTAGDFLQIDIPIGEKVIPPPPSGFIPITKDWYNLYIEDLPSWADYARNVMYESTEAWKKANPDLQFYVVDSPQEADVIVQWVKEFGVEHVGFTLGQNFIEVGLGDSNCREKWQPYSSKYVANIMTHEIGHVLGLEHSDDPDSTMYPIAQNREYGLVEEDFRLAEGYAQFMPICSIKNITSFNYHLSTDDPTYGFDVFFVPSKDEFQNHIDGKSFKYYSNPECFGKNVIEYGGKCSGVAQESGLLVIVSEKLTNPLTTINVKWEEQPVTTTGLQSTTVNPPYSKTIEDSDISKDESATPLPSIEPPVKNMEEAQRLLERGNTLFDQGNYKDSLVFYDQVLEIDSDNLEAKTSKNLALEKIQSSVKTDSGGGGCLIATATFGTELAPQVQQLRELRDTTLLQTESGSAFMSGFNQFYYSFSPTIADWERQNPVFKEAVKLTITPLLSSLSILNYVNMDSEAEVLGYGISLIVLNIGMYFVAPALVIHKLRRLV